MAKVNPAPWSQDDQQWWFSQVKVGKVPVIKLGRQQPVSHEEAAHIKWLIAQLAEIDSGDYGLSPTLSGTVFPVLPGLEVIARPDSSPALRNLIALGPRALPFLLASLDDRTPTRLIVRSAWGTGGQIPGKPGDPFDAALTYTATIGDVCLVEIGQIVGRPYEAISYAPGPSVSIDSPTHDPKLATRIRMIWSSKNPAQHLLDSLLLDYSDRGTFDGKTLDSMSLGSALQVDAAMRLLYYFPRESAPIIAVRLGRLDVNDYPGGEGFVRREVSNQVSTNRFIQAVTWCKEPSIRSSLLLGIFKRTTDPEILVSALPGIGREHAPLVRSRVSAFLEHVPPYVGRAFGDEMSLLMAYARWGKTGDVKAVFKGFLEHASAQSCANACGTLSEIRPEWDLELLTPLLSDQRSTAWTYSVDPKQSKLSSPIRVCDEAAQTLAKNYPDLTFKLAGTHEDLDRQIAVMRELISKGQR